MGTLRRTKQALRLLCGGTVVNKGHASGVELRSRVDGRFLSAQLRVREHCRWRVTPSLSLLLVGTERTHFCVAGFGITFVWLAYENGSRSSTRHHVARPKNVQSRNIPTLLYLHTGPYLAGTSLRGLYFRAYVGFARFF